MDNEMKALLGKLGEAITDSVQENPEVARVVRAIYELGYETRIGLEAAIGLESIEDENAEVDAVSQAGFTNQDLGFLRSLRIGNLEETDNDKPS